MSKSNLAEVLSLNSSDTEHKDGDGDGGGLSLLDVIINFALNGYYVTFLYDDGSEERVVHEDFDDLMKDIRSRH